MVITVLSNDKITSFARNIFVQPAEAVELVSFGHHTLSHKSKHNFTLRH